MKYEQALIEKLEIGNSIIDNDMEMTVVIAPKKEEDFMKFVDEYRIMNYKDDSAVSFSSDGEFRVCALWTDGSNVIYKHDLKV